MVDPRALAETKTSERFVDIVKDGPTSPNDTHSDSADGRYRVKLCPLVCFRRRDLGAVSSARAMSAATRLASFPARPWQRLHADFAECRGKHYLIIVDAHTKWIDMSTTTTTNARSVISEFRKWFARFGLPLQVVIYNGPRLGSSGIRNYMMWNAIAYCSTSSCWPRGNGGYGECHKDG
ncbi:Uncharacterized protein K02A2.6 [Eumeta japonica]|uniref:Uncharacterized protein K02A2.6 n=1 Tax=Eumeta variegata TaxID=151549 RepID=A0A4C1U6L4_EUMVA|nr:Uncharacterized protein K02A2.6 [Eumeta japonica]